MKILFAIMLTLCLSGCVTKGVSKYCDIAKPIYLSRQDVLTQGTKTQVLTENTKYKEFCK